MYESFTFWLSVFGSITGFAALIMHFWRFLQELPSLNFYFPSGERGKMLIGYITDYGHMDAYGQPLEDTTKFTFYIWARATNNSEKPITLLEIILEIDGFEPVCLDSSSSCSRIVPVTKTSTISVADLIKPVITIDPYSAIEGNLFFGPYTNIPADNTKAKLIVKTSRKTFKTKLLLHPVLPPNVK
ncbi:MULTISPECIES: hypothetical protein [Tepidanaerobacter]|uniref:hypothetical protein n=1 Tax=Tepidanaerobacter TaxID=499228 RepID=UPI001BD31EB6|nr:MULTISPECIES: hypothetical protein [Tepidanaerobacter]